MERIILTNHSIERFSERLGIEKVNVCQNYAERAWKKGKTSASFDGRLKKAISFAEKSNPDVKLRVHGKNCYIFSNDGVLITVYSIAHIYDKYIKKQKPYEPEEDDDYEMFSKSKNNVRRYNLCLDDSLDDYDFAA